MDRQAFVRTLKRVAPALAHKDFIPVFACFCFTEETVLAYDDVIALESPLKDNDGATVELRGAVRGQPLMSYFQASRSRHVRVVLEDKVAVKKKRKKKGEDDTPLGQNVVFYSGKKPAGSSAQLRLGLIPEEDFLFTMPSTKGVKHYKVSDGFLERLKKCVITLGVDPSHPWRMGVTCCFSKKGIVFYSTDDHIMTATSLEEELKLKGDIILPPRFVNHLLDISRGDPADTLYYSDEWVLVEFKSGLRLFSRLISDVQAERYAALIAGTEKDVAEVGVIDKPASFERCLEKALSVLTVQTLRRTNFNIGDDQLHLETITPIGRVDDKMRKLGADVDAVRALISYPDLMRKIAPHCHEICFTEKCVYFRGEGVVHIVSILAQKSEE